MKCGLCGNDVRKTAMVVLLHDGNVERKRACAVCVRRGVLITTMPRATPTLTKTLDADEKDVREVLRKLARYLRGLARAYCEDGRPDARSFSKDDGLQQAADVADVWAARPSVRQ